MPRLVYRRVLRRAAEVKGGYAPLAAHLNVKLDELTQWVHGFEQPPERVFLAAVDIVMDPGAPRAERSDPPA